VSRKTAQLRAADNPFRAPQIGHTFVTLFIAFINNRRFQSLTSSAIEASGALLRRYRRNAAETGGTS